MPNLNSTSSKDMVDMKLEVLVIPVSDVDRARTHLINRERVRCLKIWRCRKARGGRISFMDL
jgi:hypothetical protein